MRRFFLMTRSLSTCRAAVLYRAAPRHREHPAIDDLQIVADDGAKSLRLQGQQARVFDDAIGEGYPEAADKQATLRLIDDVRCDLMRHCEAHGSRLGRS